VILDPIADKGLLLSGIITLSISNWSEIDPGTGDFRRGSLFLSLHATPSFSLARACFMLLNGKVQVKPNWTGKVATVLQMIAIAWVMLQFHFLP